MAIEILYIILILYITVFVGTEVFVSLDVLEFLVSEINACVKYGDSDNAIFVLELKPRFTCCFQEFEGVWLSQGTIVLVKKCLSIQLAETHLALPIS